MDAERLQDAVFAPFDRDRLRKSGLVVVGTVVDVEHFGAAMFAAGAGEGVADHIIVDAFAGHVEPHAEPARGVHYIGHIRTRGLPAPLAVRHPDQLVERAGVGKPALTGPDPAPVADQHVKRMVLHIVDAVPSAVDDQRIELLDAVANLRR